MYRTRNSNWQQPPIEQLLDPERLCMSVSDAATILHIAKSTAHNAYTETGLLCDGVPVIKVGRRYMVSTKLLRIVLGVDF